MVMAMTERYSPIENGRVGLSCALVGALLLASGCGKPESGTDEEGTGHVAGHGSASVSTAHSHGASGETCFICDPSKRDKGRLWCREHGRYEDRCWLCHPELEDRDRLYCKEHALYEDECFLCHPELKSGGESAHTGTPNEDAGEGTTAALFCHEHQVQEAECAICQPDLAAALTPGESMKV